MTRRELNEMRWGSRLFARKRTKVTKLPHPPLKEDPFKDHPIHCKCYFHR